MLNMQSLFGVDYPKVTLTKNTKISEPSSSRYPDNNEYLTLCTL